MKWLNGYKIKVVLLGVGLVIMLTGGKANAGNGAIEITVLYDNYTLTQGCTTDWGFSCFIKGMEKCILFDAGAYGNILLGNMDKLDINAQDAELMVISHNHGDHTGNWQTNGGVFSFLARNSNILAYLPSSVPSGPINTIKATGATTVSVYSQRQICDGVHLTGLMAGIEQSMVMDTPKGLVVVTGCAHPGIVSIIQKAKQMLDKDIYFVFGGFHLLNDSDSQVMSKIEQFKSLGVQKVGASHCTGDRAIELFEQEYGNNFVPIGVGQLTIPVEYDLNGDGVVDSADMCIMVDHWQTKEPSCDIAPGLFGDGIVDVQDLVVLAEHLFEDINDPTLLAHWALDETEGMAVADSAGDNNGYALGEPVWQPEGGIVNGAIQLDGIDDYIITGAPLNPGNGSFSVLAWVNGGGPSQVILSQQGATNWLMTDAEGNLITDLRSPGRSGSPLLSQTNITDGNWHRIGFVWNGSNRTLYVDGIAVAQDAQDGLRSSDGGLYIGTGKAMEAGTYFSGLIDDVRIYNRVVIP
ncbi:MAG: LamG-like jellyroll fold domain-containing protein [Planctomycetota bacterium]|jgi:7,8-dihydropterin-6-yl-methyl-4-(beta-D-ribofuranosyl)aminobenzene 5'-phosphate synthase